MISRDEAAKEEKEEKRFKRIMRNAIIYAGVGIGLLLVRPFFGGAVEGETPDMATASLFTSAGVALIGCGGLVVVAGLFLRKHLFKVNLLLTYGVMPIIIIKALLAWQS